MYTHIYKCTQMYCVRLSVCVCICSCSRRCRLETTTIASPGKRFRRRRKFNMPYLYFLYALVWALFCAGLRSLSALPPSLPLSLSLSLFLFVLSFVSMYLALALALALLWLFLLLLGTIELCRRFRSQKCPEGNGRN